MDLKETTDKVIKYKLKYSAQELEGKLDKVDQEYSLEEKEKLNGLKNYDDSQIKSDINTLTENKLDKNQGIENSGKVLGTNANGEVIPLNGYGFEYDEETKMLKYGTDPTTNLNQGIGLDDTLSKRGYAADAGAVGELKEDLEQLKQNGTGLSTQAINKLEEVGNYIAYTTADGGSKWTELISILRNGSSGGDSGDTDVTLTSISATYTGGDVSVGTALNDLTGITVTAHYSDGSTVNVTGYTLSGTIGEGCNTIIVSYGGKSTTFTVTGVLTPLYSLTNTTFDGTTAGINTGVSLLATDIDFTIAFDCEQAWDITETELLAYCKCMVATDPYPGIAVQKNSIDSSENSLLVQWMTAKAHLYNVTSYASGRLRFVLTHTAASDEMSYYVKYNDGSIIHGILSGTYQSVTNNITIGGSISGSQKFKGTVNSFAVYDKVFTDNEVSAFLE